MKVILLALVLAVVMVVNSVAKPTKVTIPPELLDEIKLKGFEIFQKYLKWKEGLPPGGNTKFQAFFLEWLKAQKVSRSLIAEAKAENGEEEASPVVDAAEAEEDAEDGEYSQNYEDDEQPSEIPKGSKTV
jgi:hypothetical protein